MEQHKLKFGGRKEGPSTVEKPHLEISELLFKTIVDFLDYLIETSSLFQPVKFVMHSNFSQEVYIPYTFFFILCFI
jgi:hypothetical protein